MTDSSSSPYTAYHKEIQLPSKGILYNGKVPDGLVYVEPMGTAQEKLFSSGRDGTAVINKIFDDCLTSPIPHQDLVLGDLVWCLINIRAVSRGPEYQFNYVCDNCRKKTSVSVNLLDFEIRSPSPDVVYPFEVTLPILGDTLGIRLLTGKDTEAVERYGKQVARHSPGTAEESQYVYRLARRIASINGEQIGVQEVMKYVEKVRGLDSQAIDDAIEDNEVGPVMLVYPTCQRCAYDNDAKEIPVTGDFFRPSKRRRPISGNDLGAAVVSPEEP